MELICAPFSQSPGAFGDVNNTCPLGEVMVRVPECVNLATFFSPVAVPLDHKTSWFCIVDTPYCCI